jgi:DNA polymerase-3 subunit beta
MVAPLPGVADRRDDGYTEEPSSKESHMEFTIKGEEFAKQINIAARLARRNSPVAVLSTILMEAEANGKVQLTATDLEGSVVTSFDADVKRAGRLALRADLLKDLSDSFGDGDVEVRLGSNLIAQMSFGPFRDVKVHGIVADEFPPITRPEVDGTFSIDRKVFADAVGQVAPVIDGNEYRPMLGGVDLRLADGKLTLAATDGHRLAVKEVVVDWQGGELTGLVIPGRLLRDAVRTLTNDGPVEVRLAKARNQLAVVQGNVEVGARLLDGSYPAYEEVIPKSCKATITVSRTKVAEAIGVMEVFGSGRQPVLLSASRSGGLVARIKEESVGESQCEILAKVKGADLQVGFSPKYLGEAVGLIEGDDLELSLNGDTGPAVLRGKGDSSYVHVLMPIRMPGAVAATPDPEVPDPEVLVPAAA